MLIAGFFGYLFLAVLYIGWSGAVRRTMETHEAFEVSRQLALNAGGRDPINFFRLKPGFRVEDVRLGPYGYAENAA